MNDSSMKNSQRNCALLLFRVAVLTMLFLSPMMNNSLWANIQQRSIPLQGKIVSTNNEPLIGVSISIKGTSSGTLTDMDGLYSVNVKKGDVLVFTYVGYGKQEITYNGQSKIDVTMLDNDHALNEVVVIGYGVQKKKLSTGANLQVKGDELAKMNTTSPLQALQGKTPGVQISSTSGQPGSDMKVVIRGLGTVGNSGPLYIIDGIEGDITTVSAADIESIDVLKDAASAAIYGSQAGNGVVLVTTKSGSANKGHVTFDAYYGSQRVARKIKMLNAAQYKTIMNESHMNSGSQPYDDSLFNTGTDTDWISQMFHQNAKTQNYNIGINGGSDASTYALSLNYTGQEGIVGGPKVSNYERYGFRVNTEHFLYDKKLIVGEHMNFNYIKNNGISVGNQYNNTLRSAFNTSPISPVYSSNNLYDSPYNDTSNSAWYNGDGNPYGVMMTNNQNGNDAQYFMADLYAELQPIKGLKLRTTFGINHSATDYHSLTPLYQFSVYSYNTSHTTVSQSSSKGNTLTWSNTANYHFDLNKVHSFDFLAGTEFQRYDGTYLNASNWNLLSEFNDLSHAYLDNTSGKSYTDSDGNIVETKTVGGGRSTPTRKYSYFGRFAYNYAEKYMINATMRADGSSKFAKGHQWGYFPSVSVGWNMTTESFMKSTSSWLDQLKLRASWGQVGNQNIDDFAYASTINTTYGGYVFGTTLGTNTTGSYQEALSNENIKWEKSEQIDFGMDAHMLKNRLGVNADFYIKTTKDWLVQAPILATAGANAPYINGGSVKNTGIELAFTWNDHINDFNYNISMNGAYNKNKVGKIPTDDGIIHGTTNMLYDNSSEFYRAQNGHELGYFWGYKTAGIFQNEADIAAWKKAGNGILQSDVKPGDVKYVDLDKNGTIDTNDKTDLGSGIPDYTYGFNLGFSYKNFDFAVNAYGTVGNKIVQSYRNVANSKANYTTEILNRWHGDGTSNKIPRVNDGNINWQFSDLFIHNGDFLRISNITLGYDFAKLIKWKYLSSLRFYGSVQNAFTFTKYNGMDPEIGYGTSSWVQGVDLGYYPRPRTCMFGVSMKF